MRRGVEVESPSALKSGQEESIETRAPQRAVNENIYLLKVEGAAATIDAMVAEGRISEWREGGREGGRTVSHVHWSHGDTFLR